MIALRRFLPAAANLARFRPRTYEIRTRRTTSSSQKPPPQDDEPREKPDREKGTHLPAALTSFEHVSQKNKESYLDMVTIFDQRSVHRRNHVEFIYAALRNMEDFGVHQDLDVYKALINVMPKGKFIPTNMFQAEFMHYPKQQQCMIDLLEQMEDWGVMPDYEMEDMLVNVFGRRGHPVRKYWRMMYWMPKFKNLSPWLLPNPVPNDALELAKLAVERMGSVDVLTKVDVYDTADIEEAMEKTWIVSGISTEQSELIRRHKKTHPMYIEGPFLIWMRNRSVNYFTLRADADPDLKFEVETADDKDDVSKIHVPFFGVPMKEKRLALKRSVHQQDDGTIFAICATGTSTKDSLLSWIRFLERNGNADLGSIPILFKFKSTFGSDLVIATSDVR